jgi:hypothetical protein
MNAISFPTYDAARSAWAEDSAQLARNGIVFPEVRSYLPKGWRDDWDSAVSIAMDAQVGLSSTTPSAAIPAFLTTLIDPAVIEVVFAKNQMAEIFGEEKRGSWIDETIMFEVVEHTGEVSSYGDYNNNGRAGANVNFPQRQAYLFQTIKQYGERELERAGRARLNWAAQMDRAAATVMAKFLNLTYAFGVAGLENYGLLNDPNLAAYIAPGTKQAGNGNVWIYNGNINATANEVYADIQAVFGQLVQQTAGVVDRATPMTLALSPQSSVALTATNTYNVNVEDLLKKNFPNLKVKTAVQYGVVSASNPQGITGGNVVQLIAENLDGQDTGMCAFNEKMRAHPVIRDLSAFKQKVTGGTWGTVLKMPVAVAQMIGV